MAQVQTAERVPRKSRAGELPLISVVTPSWNQGPFLERCIQSVLDQNYPAFEHIVYDNCSDDETHEVLRRYPHIDWTSEPDRGQSDALNKCLTKARGEIIAWINADDYYLPGAFHAVARELHRDTGVMAVMGAIELVDGNGRVQWVSEPCVRQHEWLVDSWTHSHGFCQQGLLFRREVLERIGLLDPNLHYKMDYDWWLRMLQQFRYKVIPERLAGFVVHDESKTGQAHLTPGWRKETHGISRRYWGPPLTMRYWRLVRAARRHDAQVFTHAIVNAHKRGDALDWRQLADLVWRWPPALLNRHLLATLAECVRGVRHVAATTPPLPRDSTTAPAGNGRVTVVIPTYNRAALLPRAMESVLAQNRSDLCDIVVVDDGSTDDTPAVVARFGQRVRYLRQANAGAAAARNAGIAAGLHNEFTAFLDSDDVWLPDKLRRQLDAFATWPHVAFVAGHGVACQPGGTRTPRDVQNVPLEQPVDLAPFLLDGTRAATPTVMVRTAILRRVGGFCRGLRRSEDFHLWTRIACVAPGLILDVALAEFAIDAPHSLTANRAAMLRDQLAARYRLREELRARPDCWVNWSRGISRHLATLRDVAFQSGDRLAALRYGVLSAVHDPWGQQTWEWGILLRCLCPATIAKS
jgi:glycosyltransferase involved in cell wall biosynthesis